jgi:hypothetical protein
MDAFATWLRQQFDSIGFFCNIIGLIGVAVSIATWIKVRQISSRDGKRRKVLSESEGKIAVLILDILDRNESIKTPVINFLQKDQPNLKLSSNINLFHIKYSPETMKHKFGEQDMGWLHDKILSVRSEIVSSGFDKILFFSKAPLGAAAMVGAIFSNGQPLIFYQHENDTYIKWGPIDWR